MLCKLASHLGTIFIEIVVQMILQAALLSLIPPYLLTISEDTKLTVNALSPLINWVNNIEIL